MTESLHTVLIDRNLWCQYSLLMAEAMEERSFWLEHIEKSMGITFGPKYLLSKYHNIIVKTLAVKNFGEMVLLRH